ncbi:MAG: hypothetical protein PF961_02205 [Planctomycetota bacterium]|jgi:hypothetical protein|nr:hypothetical protein [Planctomycetota bacterium]
MYMRLLLVLLFAWLPLTAADIWVEGEDATTRSNAPHPWWYDKVKTDALSGGAWISHFSKDGPGTVGYRVTIPAAGEYVLWLRANHVKSQLAYKVGGAAWQQVDFERDRRGAVNIAADDKPDLRYISWNRIGPMHLDAGALELRFRFEGGGNHHGAIDCFVLSDSGFVPSGIRKPGVITPAAPDSWFPVLADDDPLDPASVIDCSDLIPAPAGQFGFLKADGDSLRFSEGDKPVKFWAVNASYRQNGRAMTPEEMAHAARWYRKYGINLVRTHTVLAAAGYRGVQQGFDPERLAAYDAWFAALKAQGISSTWSVLYPHHGPVLRKTDGYDAQKFAELDAIDTGHDGAAGEAIVVSDYINLDPALQDLLWQPFHQLLSHVNPHTGLAYKDDPALVTIEIQNESNLFFHTLNGLRKNQPPSFARMLRRGFHDFAIDRYGDRDGVAAAWGKRDRDDTWDAGELGLQAPFHWGADGPLYEFKGQDRRTGDFIAYLTTLQRDYYQNRYLQLRQADYQGLIVTTAWKGVGASAAANLYCDTMGDLIDRHNYFGGGEGGHRIAPGAVSLDSHLGQPGRGLFSIFQHQVAGMPFAVSEWTMMPPNPYKAEAAPLMAMYGMGLQDWDISYHFAMHGGRYGDGWPGLGKYATATPHYMGQFPALARAVYETHVKPGRLLGQRTVDETQLFAGRDVMGLSLAGEDHDKKDSSGATTLSPRVFALGRAPIAFDAPPGPALNLDRQIAGFGDVLKTDSLTWDVQRRVVQIHSPRSAGVVGFAAGHNYTLGALEVRDVVTPFVSLLVTSLDGRDIIDSRRILVTALARDRQTDASFSDDGSQLLSPGSAPLLLEPVQATLAFSGKPIRSVRACDLHGVPRGESLEITNNRFRIDGRFTSFYYYVER